MPSCFVPRCKSGYAVDRKYRLEKNLPKVRFFQPPNEEARRKWEIAIKREDRVLSMKDRVCSEHFLKDDVKISFDNIDLERERATLRTGAEPKIFLNYPPYYQSKIFKRKAPTDRKRPKEAKSKQSKRGNDEGDTQNKNLPIDGDQQPMHTDMQVMEENQRDNNGCEELGVVEPSHLWTDNEVKRLNMPDGWLICNAENEKKVLVHMNKNTQVDKTITFKGSSRPEIKFRGQGPYEKNIPESVASVSEAQKILNQVHQMNLCNGTGIQEKPYSVACIGGVSARSKRCNFCTAERERLRKRENRKESIQKKTEAKKAKLKSDIQSMKRKNVRLLMKVQRYRKQVEEAMRECEKKKDVLEEAIRTLPKTQEESVKACFDASKRKGPSGRRYTINWIYECMLMRISSPKLYNHIRNHEILTLPCHTTIRGYLKHFGGAFGYQSSTFELVKPKADEMEAPKRRGALLIDEVKLSDGIYFDSSALKIGGLTNFGEDATNEALGEDLREAVERAEQNLNSNSNKKQQKKNKNDSKRDKNLGDHALVVQFQPFQGSWVQNLGCFLTKSNANGEELTKLVLEGIILAENAGLFVDAIVTDGARWNRSMWAKFGITEEKPWATHPCDDQRKLFFISDFPHLLKCMRNCFVDKKIMKTPQGEVKLDHWSAVVEADSIRELGLRECPKLTKGHVQPDSWSKMKCNLAWQFWSNSVAAGMESFRFQGVEQLEDCDESVRICKLINKLSDVMNKVDFHCTDLAGLAGLAARSGGVVVDPTYREICAAHPLNV